MSATRVSTCCNFRTSNHVSGCRIVSPTPWQQQWTGLTTTSTAGGIWGLIPQQQYERRVELQRTSGFDPHPHEEYRCAVRIHVVEVAWRIPTSPIPAAATTTTIPFIDLNNPQLDYGPTLINRPSVFTGNVVYNAPLLSGQNGFVRTRLGRVGACGNSPYASGPSLTVQSGEWS